VFLFRRSERRVHVSTVSDENRSIIREAPPVFNRGKRYPLQTGTCSEIQRARFEKHRDGPVGVALSAIGIRICHAIR